MTKEFFSRALVLERKDRNDADGTVYLFTEDFGKVVARAKSVRKIKSKLSAHLQPLAFVKARFMRRNGDGFVIIDCVVDEEMASFGTRKRFDALPALKLLNKSIGEMQTDRRLWHYLIEVFKKEYTQADVLRGLLRLLGLAGEATYCRICDDPQVAALYSKEEQLLCRVCASKVSANEILYI